SLGQLRIEQSHLGPTANRSPGSSFPGCRLEQQAIGQRACRVLDGRDRLDRDLAASAETCESVTEVGPMFAMEPVDIAIPGSTQRHIRRISRAPETVEEPVLSGEPRQFVQCPGARRQLT